ncbi:glycine N-acyltransferase-like protein 3 isoform X2 [Eublepharis macularius]|uniref:Glycine N-acyltransferase-like protein n=1 Tax=Eublepharis macularius TaxID=481883 RepID=A0AA97IV31_EUBMA|nr:glycine N-acyltransferase-like protein 3 isoform X2 [Eublepharis macularius]
MLILTCPFKLQLLEGVLRRSLPQALPAVKDKWDFYANLYATFYRDADACQAMLEDPEAINWSNAFQLQGIQDGMYEAARNIAESRHVNLKPYLYQTCIHPGPLSSGQSWLKSDFFQFGTLNPSHATILNEVWDFGGNSRSLRYLDCLIRAFPSACLMDKEGQLASWCLSDPFACLAHGYTFPQYRGQGCIGAVLQATSRKLHASGFPLYCGVLPENQPSKQSLKHQDFHILPETYYMLILTPTLLDPKE